MAEVGSIRTALAAMALVSSILLTSASSQAAPDDQTIPPRDARLDAFKSLPQTDHLPFEPSSTREAWEQRAKALGRQAQVGLGLWPLPERAPLRAVVHGRVEREDYTVEKVYFESLPGHFVCGNLYRPRPSRKDSDASGAAKTSRRPAVLSPYGHWPGGRFNETDRESFAESLDEGFERHNPSGRFFLEARCVHLARMGCVVFIYDMVGYADSKQLPHGVEGAALPGGFESAKAHLHLVNIAGLQTWNSIRALDFLTSLDDVDPERIAVTGASGGGMQTQLLFAVDERPSVSVPVVSVFVSRMGAACTYGPFMRTREGTLGLAALAAPRPLCVINAGGDWTSEFLSYGRPELKKLYRVLEAEDRFAGHVLELCPHNYNALSREIMYRFVKTHLRLDDTASVVERSFEPLSKNEKSVWNDRHPKPSGAAVGDRHERAVVNWFLRDANTQLASLTPTDASSLERYREVIGGALEVQIGRPLPGRDEFAFETGVVRQRGSIRHTSAVISNRSTGSRLPFIYLEPPHASGQVVLWIHPEGKQGLFHEKELRPSVKRLLAAGFSVAGVDLFLQGEFLDGGRALERVELLEGATVQYTLGNRRPLFSERVGDILTTLRYLKNRRPEPRAVFIIGARGAGHWVAAASALARGVVQGIALDSAGFRFARLDDVRHVDFLAGGGKYHDLPGILALCAPLPMWLAGEDGMPEILLRAYAATNADAKLTRFNGKPSETLEGAVDWTIAQRRDD